ncbi:MAG: hypothetical protein JXR70_13960 [Spirochaetales bacterium]|nr:hypothetical protein [Spirochaetales bacterium]
MFFRNFYVKQRDDAERLKREIKDDFIPGLYQKESSYPVLAIDQRLFGAEMVTYLFLPCDTGVLTWVRREYFEFTGLTGEENEFTLEEKI